MSQKAKVYKGDTFSNLLLKYSSDRMQVDYKYRQDVLQAIEKEKQEREERKKKNEELAKASAAKSAD